MKTDFARPANRYRNEAVFRSAQRLIASAPAKPARRRPGRWIVFAGGLALGIGLMFYGPAIWRAIVAKMNGDQTPTAGTAVAPARKSIAARPPVAKAPPPSVLLAPPPAGAESSPLRSLTADTTPAATGPARRTWSLATTTARPGAASTSAGDVTTVTRVVTEITLRGEMRADAKPILEVELVLHRLIAGDGNTIRGTMRQSQPSFGNPVTNVVGNIRGGIITLQSADAEYRPTPGFFRLLIELPSDNKKPEIAGTWTFGGRHGTLALTIVPPPF